MKISTFILTVCALITSVSIGQGQDLMLLKPNGKVVIGDTTQINTSGNYNLYVQNGVLTERVKVAVKSTSDWSDDAFKNTPETAEVEKSIQEKSHLLQMPGAAELVKNGYELQSMDAKLLQQIEWLWQKVILIEKENAALKSRVAELETKD